MVALPYCTDPDRLEQAGRIATAELAHAGIAMQQIAQAMQILASPSRVLHGYWAPTGQPPTGIVAAVGPDDRGVLATRDQQVVRLRPIHGDDLAGAIYYTLPLLHRQACPAPYIRLPWAGYQRLVHPDGDTDEEPVTTVLVPVHRSRRATGAAEQMAELLHTPRRGTAQIYAGRRDRYGRRVESQHPMAIIDTADNVWIIAPQIERGLRWMVATPATPAAIRRVLASLLDDLMSTEGSRL